MMSVSDVDDLEVWKKVRALEQSIAGPANYVIGPSFTASMNEDPKHLLFTLARYKFAAKMLGEGKSLDVIEVGCSEGLGTMILAQAAAKVVGIDSDQAAITWARRYATEQMSFECRDFRTEAVDGLFDAAVSIDVLEHVSSQFEREFVANLCRHLNPSGFCIVGTPNLAASAHASALSAAGHINLFDAARLVHLFGDFFHNVFLFGMNDEVLHTGFAPMCHYLFVLCCNKKV